MIDGINISNNDKETVRKILTVPELVYQKEEQILKNDGSLFTKQLHTYKKLKFIFSGCYIDNCFVPNKLEIKGSLHYYWNNGVHNYNNFDYNGLKSVLNELQNKFYINLPDWKIHSLEYGVNLITLLNINKFLNHSFYNGTLKFQEPMHKPYKQAGETTNNDVLHKLYNKGFQNIKLTNDNILRYEIRINNSRALKRLTGISILSDLLNIDKLLKLHSLLIENFNDILFSDYSIRTKKLTTIEKKNLVKYQNQITWDDYKNYSSRNTFNNNKMKFNDLISNHSDNILKALCEEVKKQGIKNLNLNSYKAELYNRNLCVYRTLKMSKNCAYTYLYIDSIRTINNPIKKLRK